LRWAASRTSRGASRRRRRAAARRQRGDAARLLERAKPTPDNAFKVPLVERTLAAVLTQAKA
jgi:hypothetical protein